MSTEMEALFSSTARVRILGLFLATPECRYYQREIERETGQPIRAVQREVKRLVEIGLLSRESEGNRVFYRVNPDFGLLAELTALFRQAGMVEDSARVSEKTPERLAKPRVVEPDFDWMAPLPQPPLPASLKRLQLGGEWDQAY